MVTLPQATHRTIDQTMLNGRGQPGSWRHEFEVLLPSLVLPEGSHDDLADLGVTMTHIELDNDPTPVLRVVYLASSETLTETEQGVVQGELAEAWATAVHG